MSRGFGWVQRDCLRVIEQFERAGILPTTFNIVAEVYRVEPDEAGNRWVTDAQHVAVKRALGGLRRKGLIFGKRTGRARSRADGRTELCHHWMTDPQLAAGYAGLSDRELGKITGSSPKAVARQRNILSR